MWGRCRKRYCYGVRGLREGDQGQIMQMRLMAVALASVWLAACGGNYDFQQVQTPPDDQATASSNYIDCLRAADDRLDDGKTDVRQLTAAVAG